MTEKLTSEIKQHLKSQGKTQADVARDMGVSKQNIHQYLSGGRGGLSENWTKILEVCGLELTLVEKGGPDQLAG